MPDLECWRCGAEGPAVALPTHPDGGGIICDACYRRIYDDDRETVAPGDDRPPPGGLFVRPHHTGGTFTPAPTPTV